MHLIPLSDGRPGIRTPLHCDVHPPSLSSSGGEGRGEEASDPIKNQNSKIENSLDFISSDETLDRYGEVISVSGWRLDSYRRNPVFQNAHQYGDIIFTLGRALITEIRTVVVADRQVQALFQRIQFATDINPMAKIAHGLYRTGCLNTVSVGFIPLRWQDGGSLSSSGGEGQGEEAPKPTRRYLEQELLEVSAVPIPANPNALVLALKSGAIEKSDLKETLHLFRRLAAADSEPPSARLLRLAVMLRDLVKHI